MVTTDSPDEVEDNISWIIYGNKFNIYTKCPVNLHSMKKYLSYNYIELQTPEFKILKEVYYKIFCSSEILEKFQIVPNAYI